MNYKELFSLIKFIVVTIAIVVVVSIVSKSGFIMTNMKIDYKDLNIEVSGNEKSTQPFQD